MPFGLLPTGFVAKTLTDIRTELRASWRTIMSANVNLDDRTRNAQFIDTFAGQLAEVWDLAQAINASFDPDQATDAQLNGLAALTNSTRNPATYSKVTLLCTGTPGTTLPAGRLVGIPNTATVFSTLEDATIQGGGTVSVPAQATVTGAIIADSGQLTQRLTPVSGWTSVTNPDDAMAGTGEETNPAFRRRREAELRAQGTAAIDAIAGVLLKVEGVQAVHGFENVTLTANGDGLPPKSIEMVVEGGDDQKIREAIFKSKAGGIQAYGQVTGTVADVDGNPHTIGFSRPEDLLAYVRASLIINPAKYPTDGDTLVAEAIALYGQGFQPGDNIVASRLGYEAFAIPGVMDVSLVLISVDPVTDPLESTTIQVSLRQVAKFDTSRIIVETDPGTT